MELSCPWFFSREGPSTEKRASHVQDAVNEISSALQQGVLRIELFQRESMTVSQPSLLDAVTGSHILESVCLPGELLANDSCSKFQPELYLSQLVLLILKKRSLSNTCNLWNLK